MKSHYGLQIVSVLREIFNVLLDLTVYLKKEKEKTKTTTKKICNLPNRDHFKI